MQQPFPPQQQQRQQQLSLPTVPAAAALVARGAASFARRHRLVTLGWLWGWLVLVVLGSGTALTARQAAEYDRIMATVDVAAEYGAAEAHRVAEARYRQARGWLTCDTYCVRRRDERDAAARDLAMVREEGLARMSDARKVAGLWSEVGVGEVRDSFWGYFDGAKRFAKRQSMWDAMFMGMRTMSRDESFLEYLLKVVLQIFLNFSMGLIAALCVFVWGLWGIVRSYRPDPLTAVVYFVSASCAAFAFVATYLLLMGGAIGGTLYGAAKMAEAQLRIDGGGGRRRGRVQCRQAGRPHWE